MEARWYVVIAVIIALLVALPFLAEISFHTQTTQTSHPTQRYSNTTSSISFARISHKAPQASRSSTPQHQMAGELSVKW